MKSSAADYAARLSPLLIRSRDALALAGLFVLILLFLGPALLPGRVLLPLDIVTESWPPWQRPNQPADVHNPLISDVVDYIYPVRQFAATSVREGIVPLWNPYVLGGYPFAYNTQAGLFYPFSLLSYLLPGPTAVDLTVIGQLCLGAAFMFLYLRALSLRRLAAIAGAIIFSFNTLMVVWLEWQVVHAAVIWLPLQLYLVERLAGVLRARRAATAAGSPLTLPNAGLHYAVLAGIAFALPWLGGHWNWALYGSLTFVAYLLWRLVPLWRVERRLVGPARPDGRVAALIAVTLVVGVALSLVQVLPAFNYLRQGHRQALPFAESLGQGLLNRLVALLIPNFFGNPVHHNWWGPVNYNETTLYVGLLPLFLAGLAPLLRRDALGRFFLGWGSLGLLWALGTPAYGLLYVLPVFGGLLPSRAAVLVVFCAAVLAAMSLDRLAAEPSPAAGRKPFTLGRVALVLALLGPLLALAYALYYRPEVSRTWPYLRPYALLFLLFWLASALLLFGRLRGRLGSRWFGWLAVALLAADLFLAGYGYNTVSSVARLYPPTATDRFLAADAELFRIATLPEGVAYPPNTALTRPLANISGYEPAILQRVVDYVAAAEGQEAIYFERELMPLRGLDSPLMDLLNVKYVVTTADWHSALPALDVAQEQADVGLALSPEATINQGFRVTDAGLHRIDLRLRPAGEATGLVTVRVFTADGGQELAHANLAGSDLLGDGWSSFYFDAFPSEWGREFRFTVESQGLALEVAAASRDVYPDGQLFGADGPTSGDLAFATYYLPRSQLVHEDGKTRVYLNEGYFRRAFAVPQAIVAADEAEALAAVQARAAELDEVVVLELEGRPPPDLAALGPAFSAPAAVTISHYGLNRVELIADMAAPGFVVLADTYYPGWQARIDGRAAPVYRANSILRAVYVPAGQHTIEFAFRPLDFTIGAVVSTLTLLGCGLVLLKGSSESNPR